MTTIAEAVAALRARGGAGGAAPAAATPQVTYTPNGIPREPGFVNPYNPYDTGRHGEQNRELNGGQGGKVDWWDYDLGKPKAGVSLGADGLYGSGGGGGGGGPSQSFPVPGSPYAIGATLARGLLGIGGFQAQSPLATDVTHGGAVPQPGYPSQTALAPVAGPLGGYPDQGPVEPGGPGWEGALNLAALQAILGRNNLGPRNAI